MLRYRPHQVKSPLTRPTRAMIQSKEAMILKAILIPNMAPLANACRTFSVLSSLSTGTVTDPAVRASSVSGYRNLEMAREAGIDMIQDETRTSAFKPKPMYPTRTDPEMVAKPQVMIW